MQLGDSIVHKARETLERAIKLVNDTKKWGAHVVYGDTDRYVTVCSSQHSKTIGVLWRDFFLLAQQGGFVIPKRVCGPSSGCCLLSCRICKVNNTYFLGVSFKTLRQHFRGFLSFQNFVEQKRGGNHIFSDVNEYNLFIK